jgi:putative hydrolase of the HAD superfamily
MSIKNVVFDFGQVLVHFEPRYMVSVYVENKEDIDLLERVVFDRLYWDRLDEGTITDEETVRLCKERLPQRLHNVVDKIYYNWIYNIPEFEGMREIVLWLKDKGVKLCLLSNISKYFAEHSSEIPILSLIENKVMSGPIGIVKPSYEIFDHLCKSFDLSPEETLFIDDNEANIKGAASYGINAYRFDFDVEKLKKYLESIIK